MPVPDEAPTITLPDICVATPPDKAAQLDPLVNVVIHNDDATNHLQASRILRAAAA